MHCIAIWTSTWLAQSHLYHFTAVEQPKRWTRDEHVPVSNFWTYRKTGPGGIARVLLARWPLPVVLRSDLVSFGSVRLFADSMKQFCGQNWYVLSIYARYDNDEVRLSLSDWNLSRFHGVSRFYGYISLAWHVRTFSVVDFVGKEASITELGTISTHETRLKAVWPCLLGSSDDDEIYIEFFNVHQGLLSLSSSQYYISGFINGHKRIIETR